MSELPPPVPPAQSEPILTSLKEITTTIPPHTPTFGFNLSTPDLLYGAAWQPLQIANDAAVRVLKDISYGSVSKWQKLDVYFPNSMVERQVGELPKWLDGRGIWARCFQETSFSSYSWWR